MNAPLPQSPPENRAIAPSIAHEEVWEMQTNGKVYVTVTDHRNQPVQRMVTGRGSRLRISTEDRLRAQEQIRDVANDVFVNGKLVRIDADQSADATTASESARSDAELMLIFTLDFEDFTAEVDKLSEVAVRRLVELVPTADPSQARVQHITNVVAQRFAVGHATPTWEEMQRAGR